MIVRRVVAALTQAFLLALLFTVAPRPTAAGSCETLTSLSAPGTTITLAQSVAPGAFAPPAGGRGPGTGQAFKNLPAFCRVAASLAPTSDSHIKIEVWMPASGWSGKFQSVGNGGWAGSISYPAMATALTAGYATASTDTGHTGGDPATFVVGHPEKVIDFAYRSTHEMTVAAKKIVGAFYGSAPKFSYWNGCSTGGRQAMVEAQRFPTDYDGILAGAAASYVTHLQGAQAWLGQQAHKDEASYIPPAKYPMIHDAVLQACDARDGVKDGVLEDPTTCRFDPQALACKQGDEPPSPKASASPDVARQSEVGPSCLTAPQVELARKIYAGPVDSKTGRSLFPGLERGTESGWASLTGPRPMSLAVEIYKFVLFQDPTWELQKFDVERDVARAAREIGATMNSVDPNLKPFFGRGGKLLMYHGWADAGIPARASVNYYKSVLDTVGKASAADSIRLFMIPGMGHCRGGDGPDTFNGIGALEQWVEKKKAPDRIVASRVRNGAVDRTRPLCPYPQVATYKGTGSTDDAANFVCRAN